jgi:transcriptional regulator with XRE-family HTH domain
MANEKTGYSGRLQNTAGPEADPGAGGNKASGSREADSKWQAGKAPYWDSAKLLQSTKKTLDEMKKVFGKNLARIRKEAGYSQLSLSLEIGLSHNFINELEQGSKGASFLTLSKLSAVLRTPVSQFFELDKKQPASNSNDFQYPDPIDHMVTQLHEAIDAWNGSRTKQ